MASPINTWEADPRIGVCDARDWYARPSSDNPTGARTGAWVVEAGDYAEEGEPDVWIEVRHVEFPEDVAKFIVQAVKNEYARA